MKKLLMLLLVCAVTLPLPARAETPYARDLLKRSLEQGRSELKMGRTQSAETAFRRAISIDPSDPYGRYLLANLLAKTGRHEEAMSEYRTSYSLGPTGPLSEYCRQALLAYGMSIPASGGAVLAPFDDSSPEVPRDPRDRSFDRIDRQFQTEFGRKQLFVRDLSRSDAGGADYRARSIKDVTESEINHMYNEAGMHRTVSRSSLDSAAERMRREAEERGKLELKRSRERALAHEEWLKRRHADLEESASSLKEQMSSKSVYGHDLDPKGTCLYVRNYKSSPGKKRLPEPRFSVVRFVDRGVVDEAPGDVPTPEKRQKRP